MLYLKATVDGGVEKASSSSSETTDSQEAKVRKIHEMFFFTSLSKFR